MDECSLPKARPIAMTGHSAGGFYVRQYAREFPAEVAGVVLIDASSTEQIDELPGWRKSYEADKRDFARQLHWEIVGEALPASTRLEGQCLLRVSFPA
jgi:pimeloyl-ACP methyl ester carboxylesterase